MTPEQVVEKALQERKAELEQWEQLTPEEKIADLKSKNLELENLLEEVSNTVLECLDPALTRTQVINRLKELDDLLMGETGDDDEDEEEQQSQEDNTFEPENVVITLTEPQSSSSDGK